MRTCFRIRGLSEIRQLVPPSGEMGGAGLLFGISRMFSEIVGRTVWFMGFFSTPADHDLQGDLAVGAISRDCLIAVAPSFGTGSRTTGLGRTDFEDGL